MKRDCPHCGESIAWWRPLRSKGVRADESPLGIAAKCHACGGLVIVNRHPTEQALSALPEVLAVIAVFAGLAGGLVVGLIVGGVLAVGVAVLFYRLHLRTTEWNRYVPLRRAEP